MITTHCVPIMLGNCMQMSCLQLQLIKCRLELMLIEYACWMIPCLLPLPACLDCIMFELITTFFKALVTCVMLCRYLAMMEHFYVRLAGKESQTTRSASASTLPVVFLWPTITTTSMRPCSRRTGDW